MNRAILLLAPALMLASCGEAATRQADKPAADTAKTETPAPPAPVEAAYVPPGNLDDKQKASAVEMNSLVFDRAVLARLTEKCSEVSIDEPKMSAERDRQLKAAQAVFKSQDEFMVAAGMNQQAAMGEKVRQFYAKQNVEWDSPSADYCTVGKALKGQATGPGRFLR